MIHNLQFSFNLPEMRGTPGKQVQGKSEPRGIRDDTISPVSALKMKSIEEPSGRGMPCKGPSKSVACCLLNYQISGLLGLRGAGIEPPLTLRKRA